MNRPKSRTTPTARSSPAAVIALVVVIVIAFVVAARFGMGLLREVSADRQQFGPSPEVLKKMSPPGYTPYGQPPKPGEVRPAFGDYQPTDANGHKNDE